MSWTALLSGTLAVAILVYLLIALFRPEKF
ncbi:K(+)-transporting ATPase subunit F [Cupriavidus consociatus]|nr:K(+)-transporting ATPase subunit F [Cupriavidus sp. LEh25]